MSLIDCLKNPIFWWTAAVLQGLLQLLFVNGSWEIALNKLFCDYDVWLFYTKAAGNEE